MTDQKCKKCGRTIFAASGTYCKYCNMKDAIEAGALKKKKGKKHENWTNFH